jgi:membrane-bound serine protease (ClpP class)
MRLPGWVLLLAFGLVLAPVHPAPAAQGGVYLLDIKGGIGPATSDYVQRGLKRAADNGAQAVVLRIDTPGGLDAATRDINHAILSSKVPVIGWVAPEGSRAASAGTYILYACHLAAMAPATSVGAATPVSIGGPGAPSKPATSPDEEAPDAEEDRSKAPDTDKAADAGKAPEAGKTPDAGKETGREKHRNARHDGDTAMERKVINDSVAYLRSLAELRGRNVEFAEAAVRDAATLTASQALSQHVIDIVAADLPSLLRQANGREVKLGQRQVKLALDAGAVTVLQPDWRARLLGVLTEPTVAYLLLLVGLYALMIEAYTPGALFPGVTGAICLLLALYALQVLPVNYAGVALIVLGVGLMAAEFAMPSFGSLGIGGVVALVAGSLILFDTDVPGFGLPGRLILGIAVASALAFMALIWLAARARRLPVVTGTEQLVGHLAIATRDFQGLGQVQVRGEVWQAVSQTPVHRGQSVRVRAMQGLVLEVVPLDQ